MENIKPINHYHIVKRDWRKALVVTLVVVLLALLFSLVQPFLYQATVSILVLQKSSFSIDAYSASKSEERIANKLGQVVYSSSFLSQVLNSGFDIDKKYFPTDELSRREKWAKMVETDVPAGLSKLKISVYHTDPDQAMQISQAVAYVLTTDKKDYIGIDDVDLKVLDSPLVSRYPVRPNIILNVLLGLIVGAILGAVFVIVTYNPNDDKLFEIPEIKKFSPTLVPNEEREEARSVEADMAAIGTVPEIRELDEVEEMAEIEQIAEGNEPPDSSAEPLVTPDISSEFSASVADVWPEEDKLMPAPPPKAPEKEYAIYDEEEKITSMPKID